MRFRFPWAGAAALPVIAVAVNLDDPLLVVVQDWLPAAVVVLGAAGVILTAWRRRSGRGSRLALALWAAVLPAVVVCETAFHLRRSAIVDDPGSVARAVGHRFILGYGKVQEVEFLVRHGLIGGIYVTRRNSAGRSAEELQQEIAGLQALRRAAGLPPLIVATDQEGGVVSRLSPPLPARPPLATLAALPPGRRMVEAERYGRAHGEELAALGVTVNLAPVVDVRRAGDGDLLDVNSRIDMRAISGDPALVGEIALGYSRGLAAAGVTPTLKHFPGLGRITSDTHLVRATLAAAPAELEASDWRPFRYVLSGVDAHLMLGHVILPALDPAWPASVSRRVVKDLIRGAWGFRGTLITDDLTMGAIYWYGLCPALREALAAEVDLLLIAYDPRQIWRALACARDALGTVDISHR